MSKLVSKSEFARLCEVSAPAISRACKKTLRPAIIEGKIDVENESAIKYRERAIRNKLKPPAGGIDPLYEDALKICKDDKQWTATHLKRKLSISYKRAKRIIKQIEHEKPKDAKKFTHDRSHVDPDPPQEWKKIKGEPKINTTGVVEHDIPDDMMEYVHMPFGELIKTFGTGAMFKDWLGSLKVLEMINEKRLKNEQTRGKLVSRDLVKNGVIGPFTTAHVRLMRDGAKTISTGVAAKVEAGANVAEIEAYISDIISSFIKPAKNKAQRNLKNA